MEIKDFLSISQAAEYMDIHPNTLRNYINKGILKAYELPTGKKIFVKKEDLEALLTEKQTLYS